jgi:hypothetical protein
MRATSNRKLAQALGVSETAVRKALAAGRISRDPDGGFDIAKVKRQWALNTDAAQQRPAAKAGLRPVPAAVLACVRETLRDQGEEPGPGGPSFLQARTANEVLKAQERRLRLQRLKGELIDRARATAQVFTRAIRLAQDLSTVFGQDLRGSAIQLGKALEEPIQGISALRRVGVSFTLSQRELIETLVRTGQTAKAQRVILDALEQQVGGASVAEASGLTGAANRLSDAWGNLLKAIGRTDAVSGTATGALNVLARATEGVLSIFDEEPIAVRIVALNRQLVEAQDELARLEAGGLGAPMIGQRLFVDEQRQRVAELQRQVDALIDQARSEAESFADDQRRAEAGRRD